MPAGGVRGLSVEDLLAALAGSRTGLWWWDRVSDRVTWSPLLETLFGIEPGEAPESFQGYLGCIHPEDQGGLAAHLQRVLESAETVFDVEHRVLWPDGSVRWIQGRGQVQRDASGAPVRMLGTAQDVTEQRSEAAILHEQAQVLRLHAELASDYVYRLEVTPGALVPSVVGGSFERTTGYTLDEVLQIGGWTELHHPDDHEVHEATLRTIAAGEPFVAEYRIRTRDGSTRWLRDQGRPISEDDGQNLVLIGAVRDITAERELEAQLVQAQKMEALAQMAGGVAHDLNNLLTIGYSGVEALRPRHDNPGAIDDLDAIAACLDGAAELTGSLLAFSRQRAALVSTLPLGEAVSRAVALIGRTLPANVSLAIDEGDDVDVAVDETGFGQVLTNLILNAADAVGGGGRIDVRSGRSPAGPPREVASAARRAGWAFISVSDDGPGIDGSVLPRIFEPFFTTKGERGSGLGLSVSHGIVRQWGGAVTVDSDAGGSTFTVFLPVAAEAVRTPSAGSASTRHAARQSVLLVEDTPSVREVMRRSLVRHGYRVTGYETAEAALDAPDLEDFDLLLTDIGLPGMSGLDLISRIRATRPGLPVLVVSGRARQASEGLPDGVSFLAKPFRPSDLVRRVDAALAPPST